MIIIIIMMIIIMIIIIMIMMIIIIMMIMIIMIITKTRNIVCALLRKYTVRRIAWYGYNNYEDKKVTKNKNEEERSVCIKQSHRF